jgi:hypothetical protein
MGNKLSSACWILGALLTFSAFAFSQVENRTLIVNGQPGEATVIQSGGRSYVDLETLARIANGTLSFRGNQIVLTLPVSTGSAPTASPVTSPSTDPGFSQNFMKAGIEEMAVVREWRSSLAYAIQNGYPVAANSVAAYRDRAAEALRLASVAASTNSEQNALQLMTNEFQNVQKWSDKLIEATKSMEMAKYSMSHHALDNDALFQKILSCAHFLAPMLASGTFADDPSCH